MPAPSLVQIALRACIKNVRAIDHVGDAPYSVIEPILLKVDNAEQLRRIEKASPQIIGEDAQCWVNLIKRDIPNWENMIQEPKNPASWYKVYLKLQKESQAAIEQDAAALKASMEGIQQQAKERQTKVVDQRDMPKLPRMSGMRVERTHRGLVRTVNNSALNFTSGSKTKTDTAKGVLDRARREAREMGHVLKKNGLAVPTHQLSNRATQIRHVPKAMVESRMREEFNPSPQASLKTVTPAQTSPTALEAREQRLRAITSGKATPAFSQPRILSAERPALSYSASGIRPMYSAPRLKIRKLSPSETKKEADNPIPERLSRTHVSAKAVDPPLMKQSPVGPRTAAVRKAPVDIFMPSKRRRV